jgi:hypothetical protein
MKNLAMIAVVATEKPNTASHDFQPGDLVETSTGLIGHITSVSRSSANVNVSVRVGGILRCGSANTPIPLRRVSSRILQPLAKAVNLGLGLTSDLSVQPRAMVTRGIVLQNIDGTF